MRAAILAVTRRWRGDAALLRKYGHADTATLTEVCAAQIEAVVREADDDLLTLRAAARESGFSPDHLGRLLRQGRIPNAGRRGSPRIRRGDLPKKPGALPRSEVDPILSDTSKRQIAQSVVTSRHERNHDG